jgi:sialate O-acetylesterase
MRTLLLLAACLFFKLATADIYLPSIIGSHMVLQQHSDITLWGWCDPQEPIEIKTSWDTVTYKTMGNNYASWKINIRTPDAGGPYTVELTGYNNILLEDVMLGEIWLCGGQSNMAFSANNGITQALDEAPNASNQKMRFFFVHETCSETLQENCLGEWKVCTPDEMKRFSAVGYFFGQELQRQLNFPIGLINANWGGTPAEVWTPAALVEQDSLLKQSEGKLWTSDEWWPVKPGVCYNAMIHPISAFKITGVIWYQGESNTDAAFTYQKLFKTLIQAWRDAWKTELPFYYVQIAPFSGYQGRFSGALLREAQMQCLNIPNTGMVVIHDLITNVNEIHPQNKKDVGIRLANYALSEHYNVAAIPHKSPVFKNMEVKENLAIIEFSNVLTGLKTTEGEPCCFLIAGEDKQFLPAEATISGDKVIVSNRKIKKPVAVRFAFSNAEIPNLFTNESLPVASFRTDIWELEK